jgi:ABC-type lipoprotein release transport system permease subunit
MPIHIFPFVTSGFTVGIVLVAVVGAVLFALYPAMRASRLRPVEALAGR